MDNENMMLEMDESNEMGENDANDEAFNNIMITPQQLFDKANLLINGSLQIMKGRYGGGFYVKFLQDKGSKKGWLQLIICYPNNTCKSVILCKNVFKLTDVEDDNLGKVQTKFGNSVTEITPKVFDSLEYGDYRILEQYEAPNMPIPAKALWKQIIDNYPKIPVVEIYQSEDIAGIYWELYRIANEAANSNNFLETYRENEVRFLVTADEMKNVATENGMSLAQLRTELNLLGLLIKDKGSTAENGKRYNSYQLTKKINGVNQRFYALKKNVKAVENKIDTTCAVEFTEDYIKTPSETALEKARMEIKDLESSLKSKDEEIRKLYLNRIDDATPDEIVKHVL